MGLGQLLVHLLHDVSSRLLKIQFYCLDVHVVVLTTLATYKTPVWCKLLLMEIHRKKVTHCLPSLNTDATSINNALTEFSHTVEHAGFFSCLSAIYDTLYILCEIGQPRWCSLWSCPAATTSVVKFPSILLRWACLWVEAVPARHQIKPTPHLLYFCFFTSLSCIYFPFVSPSSLSLSSTLSVSASVQTIVEGLMLGSVAAWVFDSKAESPPDADSFTQ